MIMLGLLISALNFDLSRVRNVHRFQWPGWAITTREFYSIIPRLENDVKYFVQEFIHHLLQVVAGRNCTITVTQTTHIHVT